LIGRLLLRLLYRFEISRIYESTVTAIHAVDACRRNNVVVDVGGGAGGLGRALLEVGCEPGYYIVVDVDPVLASMALRSVFSEAIVASACYLPIRPIPFSVVVFNDSLHHMDDPLRALIEASHIDSRCIIVSDFDSTARPARILAFFEKLLGFPARFLPRNAVEEVLRTEGYNVIYTANGRLSSYTLAACRKRQEVD
jgi:SAM-dependent methyltransferase